MTFERPLLKNSKGHKYGESDLTRIEDTYFTTHPDIPGSKKRKWPRLFKGFTRKDYQNLVKSSLAAWTCTILMFIDPILANFGTAVFFAAIVVFILPPAGVTLTILLGGMTMIVGMCLGWAWGVAVMKAALPARSDAEVTALNRRLQQETLALVNSTGKDSGVVMQELLFDGFALDTRVTAVYFVLTCVFIYFISRLRAANPKITLTQVFAIVVADLFLTTGPLVPSFLGMLPMNLVKPGFVGIGVSMASSLLIYPESTSHLVMEGIGKILKPMRELNNISLLSLKRYPELPNHKELKHLLEELVGSYSEVEGAYTFLKIDFSYGRFNADDILSLQPSLKGLIMTFVGLADFYLGVAEKGKDTQNNSKKSKTNSISRNIEMSTFDNITTSGDVGLDDLMKRTMATADIKSQPVLLACSEALETCLDGIYQVNSRRWFRNPTQTQCLEMANKREEKLEYLKRLRFEFAESNADALVEIHEHLFEAQERVLSDLTEQTPYFEGLVSGLASETRVLAITGSVIAFLEAFILLEKKRTKSTVWFPSGLRKAFAWATGSSSTPITALPRSTYDDPDEKKVFGAKYKRGNGYEDQARRSPTRQRSKFSKIILTSTNWVSSTEGIYAARVVLATIVLGLPAVLPSTAGFYYREKGIWALLMAQTGLMPYMAEFTFGLASKIFGTVLGGLVGMAAWYIGSGLGDGNPYGLSATMAVVIITGMYFRLRVPQPFLQATILSVATVFLIVANSYVDARIPTIAPTGVGYNMFWRRTLLIVIGCSTAAVIQFIPSPTSATLHVSRSLASIISSQASLFAIFASHPNPQTLQPHIESKLLSTYEAVNLLDPLLFNLRYELSSSPWSHLTLTRISSLATQLNMHLGVLTHIVSSLSPELRARFEAATGCRDERVVGDVIAVLGVVDLGMRTGKALPALLPGPLAKSAMNGRGMKEGDVRMVEIMGVVEMKDARRYCSAFESWIGFLQAVDEIVVCMKEVLGEWGAWEEFVEDVEGAKK